MLLLRFLYICGNLVGLGTPLTSYSPDSGHIVPEMLDLMISAWSMGFAGLVYGLVGALGFVALTTQLFDERLSSRVQKMVPSRRMLLTLAEDKSGMDLEEFLVVARRMNTGGGDEGLKTIFASVDREGTGVIHKDRVGELMTALDAALKQKRDGDGDQMGELVKMISQLSAQVDALKDGNVALNSKVDQLLASPQPVAELTLVGAADEN